MAHSCIECVFNGTEQRTDPRTAVDNSTVYPPISVDYCYEQPQKIERKKCSPACRKISLKK